MILSNEELEKLVTDYSLALAVWNRQERKPDTSHNWFSPDQLAAKEQELPNSAHSAREMTRVMDKYLNKLVMNTTPGDFWTDDFKEAPLILSQNAKEMSVYASVQDVETRLLHPIEYRYQPSLLRGDLPTFLAKGMVGLIRIATPKLILEGSDYNDHASGKIQIAANVTFDVNKRLNNRKWELRTSTGMYRKVTSSNMHRYQVMMMDLIRAEHS